MSNPVKIQLENIYSSVVMSIHISYDFENLNYKREQNIALIVFRTTFQRLKMLLTFI